MANLAKSAERLKSAENHGFPLFHDPFVYIYVDFPDEESANEPPSIMSSCDFFLEYNIPIYFPKIKSERFPLKFLLLRILIFEIRRFSSPYSREKCHV